MNNPRIALMRYLAATSIALLITASPARSQDTAATSRSQAMRATTIWNGTQTPVLLSFSGGISLGAYQAGVNWVMLETIKALHYRNQAGSLSRLYPVGALPDLPVTAMSGASAGNINVLLASVHYCDPRLDDAAENSLFWKMWVQSGWDELFPEHRTGADPGALDRSASIARIKHSVDSTMRSVRFTGSCQVPLGVSVTRVRPVSLPLGVGITYRTQRMVALFTAEETGGRLHFVRQAPSLRDAGGLGAQLVLPSQDGHEVSLDDVFKVVKASSSYPIAFAPVTIDYQTPDCARTDGCSEMIRAKFMDGGVFDNNPVSLAVGMGDAVRHATGDRVSRNLVWYVDPDAPRQGSAFAARVHNLDSLSTRADTVDHAGIGGLLSFLNGFVPASRQYELQAFARQQEVLPDSERASIQSSARSHPLIGEHLNAFAAFLGTPFREFDFYVGVADGMRFVAREVLCQRKMPWVLDPSLANRVSARYANIPVSDPVRKQVTDECADREALRLARAAFAIRPVGRHIVQQVMSRDSIGAPEAIATNLSNEENARLAVLEALERSTYAKLAEPLPSSTSCKTGHFLERALCADGFDVVLGKMRGERDAMHVLRCERGSDDCVPYPDSVEQAANVIDHPQATLDRYLTRALIEMRRTERSEGSGWFRAMKAGEMVYRAADDQRGWAYDGGPSSIPKQDGLWSALAVFPYFAGTTIGTRGFQFGWQPTLHTPMAGLILEAPFGGVGIPRGVDRPSQVAASAFVSPSVGMEFMNGYFNQLGMGGRFESVGKMGSGLRTEWVSPEVSMYLLGRVLRVNVYRLPPGRVNHGHARVVTGLSLADVNGLAYWIARVP